MKKLYLQIIALFFGFCCMNTIQLQAQDQQKIDSIQLLNAVEKNQKTLVENYNKLSYLFGSINIDSSLFYSNKALLKAEELGCKKELAVAYSYIARGMIEKGNLTGSIENFSKALTLFEKERDSINILDCLRGLSYVTSYGASQLKSLNYNLKALNYAEGLKDTITMSIIYNNIGSIYKKLDNYNSSLFYFQKSLDLELSKPNSSVSDLAISYSNIGVLKVENNKFKEAEADYINVKKLMPDVESEYLQSYLFLSLSGYYTGIKKFNLAEKYIDSATIICEQYNFKQIKSRAYRKKAEWYFYQNLFKESITYFNKCLEYSTSIGVYEEFPEIYKKRGEAYSKLGLYKNAFLSLQKANAAIASLKNNSVASFLSDFDDQMRKSEIEKHQFEQALKDHQLENEATKKKVLIGRVIIVILTLLFIIVVIVFYFLRVRKDNKVLKQQHETINNQKLLLQNNIQKLEVKEAKLQELNATKDKFFSIIAHDLKSPFNAILGFSNLLAENYNSYDDGKRKEMISQIEKASESAFNLLENLLNWARSQRNFIEIKREKHHLKSLIDAGVLAYLGASSMKKINVKNMINEELEVCADSSTIKIVFSNLFSNAIKFSEVGGEILLTAQVSKNMVEICFQDAGIGMDASILESLFKVEKNVRRIGTLNEKGTGLGLILCHEFVEKNNGKIRVESEEGVGSKFYVSLPLEC